MAIGKFALPASSGGGTLTKTLREYTSSTTWTKPSGLQFIEVVCLGAGGGGGSGTTAASGVAAPGGGGGGAPQVVHLQIDAGSLTSTVAVTIGAGGTGAAGVSANSTLGNNGGTGGNTSFGSYCVAQGGRGATNRNGGLDRNISGATPAYGIGAFPGMEGRTASASGGNGSAGYVQALSSGFGNQIVNLVGNAAGGGVTTANVAGIGAAGTRFYTNSGTLTTAVAGGGSAGASGGNGTDNQTHRMLWTQNMISLSPSYKMGVGGGSGAAGVTVNGGNGGNGGLYGASGAGGGGCRNGFTSGAGGSGADGLMILIEYTI